MMLFELMNSPAKFQKYINKIFTKKLNILVIVYLDNILIDTDNDRDGHNLVIEWILEQLRKFLLNINLKKYKFHKKEV